MDDLVLLAPRFTIDEAVDIARRIYGVSGLGSVLPSERDQNVRLDTSDGARFVLKIANGADDRRLLEAQNAALAYVRRRTALCPAVVPALDGSSIVEVTGSLRARHLVRLLSWLPGVPLGSLADQPPPLLESLGAAVAELDTALDGFDHPAIHRDFYWDLARGLDLCREIAPTIADPPMRELASRVVDRLAADEAPRFARLRRAAVHNDPNDYNVLVDVPPEGGNYTTAASGPPSDP